MTYQESCDAVKSKLDELPLDYYSLLFNTMVKIIGDIHRFYKAEIDTIKRAAIVHTREIEAMKDYSKRVFDENNAKLMAIFYSLETLKSCGTHHEKRVVLTHLMATIDRMINKDNQGLSYSNDDLPF